MQKSYLVRLFYAFIVTQCLAVSPVYAGFIFVSGDSNIGSPIDGEDGAFGVEINPNNATWFTNILGSSTTAMVQEGSGVEESANAINDLYNSLVGVSSSVISESSTIDSSLLSGVDFYISMGPNVDFTTTELNVLKGFLAGGGSIFLMGENVTASSNTGINSALTFLGSNINIVNDALDPGWNITTNIDTDPFNTDVSSFTFADASEVTGGTSLIGTKTDGTTFIAYEEVTAVPVPPALWLFGSGLLGLIGISRRKKT